MIEQMFYQSRPERPTNLAHCQRGQGRSLVLRHYAWTECCAQVAPENRSSRLPIDLEQGARTFGRSLPDCDSRRAPHTTLHPCVLEKTSQTWSIRGPTSRQRDLAERGRDGRDDRDERQGDERQGDERQGDPPEAHRPIHWQGSGPFAGACARLPSLAWGCSSAGRAPRSHRGGQGFESPHLHQPPAPLPIRGCAARPRRTWLTQLLDCGEPPGQTSVGISSLRRADGDRCRRRTGIRSPRRSV
jgi:hypothetical protein